MQAWAPTFQYFRGYQVFITSFLGRQYQNIQNADDDKESVPKTQGTNGVEPQ